MSRNPFSGRDFLKVALVATFATLLAFWKKIFGKPESEPIPTITSTNTPSPTITSNEHSPGYSEWWQR